MCHLYRVLNRVIAVWNSSNQIKPHPFLWVTLVQPWLSGKGRPTKPILFQLGCHENNTLCLCVASQLTTILWETPGLIPGAVNLNEGKPRFGWLTPIYYLLVKLKKSKLKVSFLFFMFYKVLIYINCFHQVKILINF